jgi:hypothetical protein
MINGQNYQAVMWAIDNTGNAATSFKSVTVTNGGRVAGSEVETSTSPPPLTGGGGDNSHIQTTLNRVSDGSKIQPGSNTVNIGEQLQFFIIAGKGNYTYQLRKTDTQINAIHTDQFGNGNVVFAPDTAGNFNYNAYDPATGENWGWTVFVTTSTGGSGSILLVADNTKITDSDNSVIFSVDAKDSTGAPMTGVSVFAVIDGQTGTNAVGITDGTGKTGFSLTFADPSKNHTVSVTAGGVSSNTVTVGPTGGGLGGIWKTISNNPLLAAIGAGLVLLVVSSKRGGGYNVVRV